MITLPPRSILREKRIKRTSASPVSRSNINVPPEVPQAIATDKKRLSSLRFSVPIKIIIVDPKSEYCKTVWCAIGIALANVAIGAVLMIAIHYSIRSEDAHVAICTFAYPFFMSEAILAFHYANGWSAAMRKRHKKFAHLVLQVCGIVCAVIGTALVFTRRKISTTPHCITGIMTVSLAILAAIIGLVAYRTRKGLETTIHRSLGILVLITSSLCVCFGFNTKSFKNWSGVGIIYILITLVWYYTVFIVTSAFMKCMSKM